MLAEASPLTGIDYVTKTFGLIMRQIFPFLLKISFKLESREDKSVVDVAVHGHELFYILKDMTISQFEKFAKGLKISETDLKRVGGNKSQKTRLDVLFQWRDKQASAKECRTNIVKALKGKQFDSLRTKITTGIYTERQKQLITS